MANPKPLHHSAHIIEAGKIQEILSLRESRKALQERLQCIERSLDTIETDVIEALDAGAISPPGTALSILEHERRYPAWKQHFIDYAGKHEADIILEETVPTVTRKLVIK